ncbi:hypothetical protein B0T19DRAFT_438670 [Cercophora scortea]|uniref:Uncharacterized protein n=1 Tax=Cercophora scortea TaxID=314031 RepID=A0AAE0MI19_9PEZI|nr:hypothetical protein B0T19DRAFT_438670 [Cercophora scortea]
MANPTGQTTVWSLPCGTLGNVWYADGWIGDNDAPESHTYDSSCGPPGWYDATATRAYEYLSPAICPEGYTAACAWYGPAQGPAPTAGEEAWNCLPVGYECDTANDKYGRKEGDPDAKALIIPIRWATDQLSMLQTHPLTPGLYLSGPATTQAASTDEAISEYVSDYIESSISLSMPEFWLLEPLWPSSTTAATLTPSATASTSTPTPKSGSRSSPMPKPTGTATLSSSRKSTLLTSMRSQTGSNSKPTSNPKPNSGAEGDSSSNPDPTSGSDSSGTSGSNSDSQTVSGSQGNSNSSESNQSTGSDPTAGSNDSPSNSNSGSNPSQTSGSTINSSDSNGNSNSSSNSNSNGNSNTNSNSPATDGTIESATPNAVPSTSTPTLSSGAIAGIVVGCVGALIAALAAVFFLLHRKRKHQDISTANTRIEAAQKHEMDTEPQAVEIGPMSHFEIGPAERPPRRLPATELPISIPYSEMPTHRFSSEEEEARQGR